MVEHNDNQLTPATLHSVTAAKQLGGDVTGQGSMECPVSIGNIAILGGYFVSRHVTGPLGAFHGKVIIRLEIVYRQYIRRGLRLSLVHGSRRS